MCILTKHECPLCPPDLVHAVVRRRFTQSSQTSGRFVNGGVRNPPHHHPAVPCSALMPQDGHHPSGKREGVRPNTVAPYPALIWTC